ncbi:MAG TPA: DUF11 domain-containing protein, partial [Firmicutes bacterium]|nr:DUF11 domain-containing protein [Bacillota bacterium]
AIITQPGAAAQYIVRVNEENPVSGAAVTVQAQLADQHGNLVAQEGRTVQWSATGGGSFDAQTTVTDATGLATVTFTVSTVAGTKHVVTATDGENSNIKGDSPAITTRPGAAAQYIVRVDEENPVSGSAVTVQAQLADQYGNPVAQEGRTVHWSATGGGSFDAQTTVTDATGLATVTFTVSTVAGTEHVVTATDGEDGSIKGNSPTITTLIGAKYLVSVSETAPLAGSEVTVQAQLADENDNPISAAGQRVNWTATNGGSFSESISTTNADGIAAVKFTVSDIAGTQHVVTATDADYPAIVGQSPTIAVQSPIYLGPDGTVMEGAKLTRVADGKMAATITVQLKRENGENLDLPGVLVRFTTSLGRVNLDAVATNEKGAATVQVTSTEAGEAEVTAEVNLYGDHWQAVTNGSPVKVTFLQPDNQLTVNQSVQPGYAGYGEQVTFDITVKNGSNTTQTGISVTDYLPAGFILDESSVSANSVSAGSVSAGSVSAGAISQAAIIHAQGYLFDAEKGTITWNIDQLAPGQSVTFSFSGVAGTVPEGTELQNLVVVQAAGIMGVGYGLASVFVGNWPKMNLTVAADVATAAVGDVVGYTVELENRADVTTPVALRQGYIESRLPAGFVYLEGSTRLNGQVAADPAVNSGTLVWQIGDMTAGTKGQLTFAAAVSAAAVNSGGINVVQVRGLSEAGYPFETESAEARVTVEKGLFGTAGMLAGSVFADLNGNGLRDAGEPGIAGARLVTDEGIEIITDDNGFYSIPGLYPGVYTVELVAAESRTVRVPVSGMTTLDFAVAPVRMAGTGSGMAGSGSGDGLNAPDKPEAIAVGLIDVMLPAASGDKAGDAQVVGAFYKQMPLFNGLVMTVRYTSRPQADEKITAFPAGMQTGDQSRTRDLAPSQDSIYFKVAGEEGSLLYGDFTLPEVENRFVTPTGRLTGWQAAVGGRAWEVTAFTTSVKGTEYYEEIPATGLSGPYYLAHTPVLVESETVWLVQMCTDNGMLTETGRARLTRGVDYVLDPHTGSLWFNRPLPSFTADDTSLFIHVHYTVADGAAGGTGEMRTGLQLSAGAGSSLPFGLTWQRGGSAAAPVDTVGIHGAITFGGKNSKTRNAELTYELVSQANGNDAGKAAHLEWRATALGPVGLGARVHKVTGTVERLPGGKIAEGLQMSGEISYRLGNSGSLKYTHGIYRTKTAPDQHEDSLAFSLHRRSLRYLVEWQAQGTEALPVGQRSSWLRLGTEWTPNARHVLSVDSRWQLSASSTSDREARFAANYRFNLAENMHLNVGYQSRATSSTAYPEWLLSLGTSRQDWPNIYGLYRLSGEAADDDEVLIGLRHAWNLTKHTHLAVNAEKVLAGNDVQTGKTTLSWSAGYSGFRGHDLSVRQELVTGGSTGSSPRYSLTMAAAGELLRGLTYSLYSRRYDPTQLAQEEKLVAESGGSLAYRDQKQSRLTVFAQAFDRVYKRLYAAEKEDIREVQVLALDWSHRLFGRFTLSNKLALRQTVREWTYPEGDVAAYGTQAFLCQSSVYVPVAGKLGVELFGRRIVDSAGADVRSHAVELLYDLSNWLTLGVGMADSDLNDPDLQDVAQWRKGVYFRLRAKF